jgi:uncharacterized Fe-S cluster-containing radical SAM superfamily protein
MNIDKMVHKAHMELIKTKSSGKYKILKDFSGTYIEKDMQKEEKMLYPIFRIFIPVKPSRDRKLNINLRDNFNPYNDSLLDYPTIIGYKLNKSWEFFNRFISIHIPLCPNNCWHCYLPKELYVGTTSGNKRIEELSPAEIVAKFFEQRQHDQKMDQAKQSNVLRITGGEPFLVPELILECLKELNDKKYRENPDDPEKVFLWTETNLEPFVGDFMNKNGNEKILEELSKYENFAVHPCFHGIDNIEFDNITGKDYHITLGQQIEGLKKLVKAGIDVYPTIGSNVCNPERLPEFFKCLRTIRDDIPMKIALVEYKVDYEPIGPRLNAIKKEDKPDIYPRYAALRTWNQLLLDTYGVGYGVIPRHLASALFSNKDGNSKNTNTDDRCGGIISREESLESKKKYRMLYFFKGSYRVLYHRETLENIALPEGYVNEVFFDRRWVQEDLFFHMEKIPGKYKNFNVTWSYVVGSNAVGKKEDFGILPYRMAEIVEVYTMGDILFARIKMGKYISWEDLDLKEMNRIFRKYFGKKDTPPGGKYLLPGESLIEMSPQSQTNNTFEISHAFSHEDISQNLKGNLSFDFKAFQDILTNLVKVNEMKKSLFYRIIPPIDLEMEKTGTLSRYKITGGKTFKIELEYFLPNYKNFDEKNTMERAIHFEASSPTITPVGTDYVVLSKYGKEELYFHTQHVENIEEVVLTFSSKHDLFSAAKIDLKLYVLPPSKPKRALKSLVGAFLLAFSTSGIALASQEIPKGKSIWGLMGSFFEKFFAQSCFNIILNLAFFILLTAIFYFLLFLFPQGIPIKLK